MSELPKGRHPFHVAGPFDIISKVSDSITGNNQYGAFVYHTTISFTDSITRKERNLVVQMHGYGSRREELLPDVVYSTTGRFVPLPGAMPNIFIQMPLAVKMGPTAEHKNSPRDRLLFFSTGIVSTKKEVLDTGNNGKPRRNLIVTMNHTDYSSETKTPITFAVEYYVQGNPYLVNSLNLFATNREFFLTGSITGINDASGNLTANVLNVVMNNGNPANPSNPAGINLLGSVDGTPSTRRPGMIMPNSTPRTPPVDPTSTDTDAAPESSPVPHTVEGTPTKAFVDTFPKKRGRKAVLQSAKKNLKKAS